jgi:hypothetical protein
MQFAPFALHVPDWHTVAAVPEVQPAWPSRSPHLPFVLHVPVAHCVARVQV